MIKHNIVKIYHNCNKNYRKNSKKIKKTAKTMYQKKLYKTNSLEKITIVQYNRKKKWKNKS